MTKKEYPKIEDYDKDLLYAEQAFPGITKYECYDPFIDYIPHSCKCKNCQRNKECERELEQITRVIDKFGSRKPKKSTKPKRKICKCKK